VELGRAPRPGKFPILGGCLGPPGQLGAAFGGEKENHPALRKTSFTAKNEPDSIPDGKEHLSADWPDLSPPTATILLDRLRAKSSRAEAHDPPAEVTTRRTAIHPWLSSQTPHKHQKTIERRCSSTPTSVLSTDSGAKPVLGRIFCLSDFALPKSYSLRILVGLCAPLG